VWCGVGAASAAMLFLKTFMEWRQRRLMQRAEA
jgi:hypothetical protein